MALRKGSLDYNYQQTWLVFQGWPEIAKNNIIIIMNTCYSNYTVLGYSNPPITQFSTLCILVMWKEESCELLVYSISCPPAQVSIKNHTDVYADHWTKSLEVATIYVTVHHYHHHHTLSCILTCMRTLRPGMKALISRSYRWRLVWCGPWALADSQTVLWIGLSRGDLVGSWLIPIQEINNIISLSIWRYHFIATEREVCMQSHIEESYWTSKCFVSELNTHFFLHVLPSLGKTISRKC